MFDPKIMQAVFDNFQFRNRCSGENNEENPCILCKISDLSEGNPKFWEATKKFVMLGAMESFSDILGRGELISAASIPEITLDLTHYLLAAFCEYLEIQKLNSEVR